MFKQGDVVLGAFATPDGTVLNHYSVVLDSNSEGVMLVYTTSLKEHSQCSQRFSAEDMMLAAWTKPCRYDASQVCVVPATQVRKTGRITQATFKAIRNAFTQALRSRNVKSALLKPTGEVVRA